QCLLAAGRAAGEVRAVRLIAIERQDQRLGERGHQMRGAPAEILPLLRMTDQRVRADAIRRRRTHVGVGGGKAVVDAGGKLALEETARIAAVAGAEIAAVVA